MIKHIINPSVGLGGEVTLNDLVKQLPALVEEPGQHITVKGEIHLMEADRRHGQLMHFLFKLLHQCQLVLIKLVIPVEDGQLDDGLDEVFDDFLSLLLILGIFLGYSVQLVQHFAACVIN